MNNKEYIIPFENNKYYQGRVVVYLGPHGYNADVIITHIETGKIYASVKQLYHFKEEDELLQEAVLAMSNYLEKSKDNPAASAAKSDIEID